MKRITYVGRHKWGVYTAWQGVRYWLEKGKAVEVPAEFADKLASEQPDAFIVKAVDPDVPETPKRRKRAETSEENN